MRRDTGFTLMELLLTMVILGFVLAGITQTFTGILTQFKQQSKIAETSIEGIVGLELLRQDLENAGFGLYWRSGAITYQEASAATAYNDSPSDPPRAYGVGSGAGWNGSDELIIKATNAAMNGTAQKWSYIDSANTPKVWIPPQSAAGSSEDLKSSDRVIVTLAGTSDSNRRTLVTASTGTSVWRTTFGATADFVPSSGYNFVYGVDHDTDLRMPFNRADYYIVDPANATSRPQRCAPNASVLQKTVISQADGVRRNPMPLLDCVAGMQIVFRLDRDGDGTIESNTDVLTDNVSGAALTAEQIRNQVKEVRVYILAHEGQKDTSYTHQANILVGEAGIGGSTFNVGPNVNYRWKLYILVVKPKNLK